MTLLLNELEASFLKLAEVQHNLDAVSGNFEEQKQTSLERKSVGRNSRLWCSPSMCMIWSDSFLRLLTEIRAAKDSSRTPRLGSNKVLITMMTKLASPCVFSV